MTVADDNWYYALNDQQLGPVTLAALRSMVANGQVGAGDLVWTQGMAQWTPARSVPEIASVLLGSGGGGVGNYPPSSAGYAAYPAPPPGNAGQLGYGVGQTYYQREYGHVDYAGFWLRFCALLIDQIICVVPFAIIGFIIGVSNPQAFTPGAQPSGAAAGLEGMLRIVEVVVGWLYYSLQESSARQATLGKLAVGIKVTDLDGQRISFGRATGRYFGKILSGCLLGIGYIMAAFTEKKQALHDQIASTLVVRK